MDINKILKMNSSSESKISYEFESTYSNAHYQLKGDSELNLDELPELDDKYKNEGRLGWLAEDNIFDPSQKISYTNDLGIRQEYKYTSETLVKLLQKRIKEYIHSGDLSIEDSLDALFDLLGLRVGMYNLIEEIADEIECEDLKSISESDEADTYLWATYFQLEYDEGSVYIEEL